MEGNDTISSGDIIGGQYQSNSINDIIQHRQYLNISNNLVFEISHIESLCKLLDSVDCVCVVDYSTMKSYSTKIRDLRKVLDKYSMLLRRLENMNKRTQCFKLTHGPINVKIPE